MIAVRKSRESKTGQAADPLPARYGMILFQSDYPVSF